MDNYLKHLTTEMMNIDTVHIDECSTEEMLRLINQQDQLVPLAVQKEIPNIGKAVDVIYDCLKRGGRMFYIGAGSSGRLGVLDASECPPTYGVSPELVQGYIAGGDIALRTAVEGYEDNAEAGVKLIKDCGVTAKDVVVGITASGSAAFVLAAIQFARETIGARTIGLVNNANSKLSALCEVCIAPVVGPEVIVGSTRMKSGTAQKLVLNMLTTCTMIKLGKVYGNLMVDLRASNKKLHDRAARIVCAVTGVDYKQAEEVLVQADYNTKLAIMMIKTGLDNQKASEVLNQHDGRLKLAAQACLKQ